MWWAHVVIVLGFLAYLPYSKHLHLLMAPFSVLLTDLKPKGALPQEEASATDAATFDLRDFTWRELLTPLACAECGRCDRSCPAFTSGASFSPQTLVHHMKEHILEAGPALLAEDGKNASECIESPEAGLALMDYLVGRDKAVIIDSLLMEPDEAGKVFEWDLNELGRPTAFSPHYVGLCEIRELARQLGLPFPDAVKVFGVAVRNPFTMGEPMSPEVEAALESVIERVHVVIQDWRRTLECH
jgi:hydrogenase maturation protease